MKILKYASLPIIFMVSHIRTAEAATGAAKVAGEVFGRGGPGYAIVQLMFIAAVGALAGFIAQAVGKGQIAGFIKIITVFSCISVVATQILNAINVFCKLIGI